MTIKDRVGQWRKGEGMLDGKGKYLAYAFFRGEIDPAMFFIDAVTAPGAYAGYHRHEEHETILYVVSGRAEHFQEGDRCVLEPGDAVLVKRGQAHAIRSIGQEDLRHLEFLAPRSELDWRSSLIRLPLPETISDWE